jgi:EAL domain-containing protein (putative c-di-GMP-specific phosphodiesterase class I)
MALRRGVLLLKYQPQVDVQTRKIAGVEALLRWRHPEYGAINPSELISIVERKDLIHGIGAWALTESCR